MAAVASVSDFRSKRSTTRARQRRSIKCLRRRRLISPFAGSLRAFAQLRVYDRTNRRASNAT
jgi:hypothetical protein